MQNAISALEREISALESGIRALESSSVPWEHLLPFFTLLVVVGVATELWVIRHEWRDDMEAWALAHFWTLRFPGRPSRAKFGIEIAGVLLIFLGVAGEFAVGIKITVINGKLRDKSAELRSKGDELRGQSDQLIAFLTMQAETEKHARVKLEQHLQARRLTGKQKEQLTRLLSASRQQIMIGWCMFGSDCKDFANDIGEAFNNAGWKTFFSASSSSDRGIEVGFVKGSDEALAAHWVPIIRSDLSAIGVESRGVWLDPNDRTLVGGFEKNVLYLIVHEKPEFPGPISK